MNVALRRRASVNEVGRAVRKVPERGSDGLGGGGEIGGADGGLLVSMYH